MSRSFARGDYRLIVAIESASSAGSWYRVLQDKQSLALSCDCPRWIMKRQGQERGCKHTEAAGQLPRRPDAAPDLVASPEAHVSSLIAAARDQWRGLEGTWRLQEQDRLVGRDRYRFVTLNLETPSGLSGMGQVAFAQRHGLTTARLIPGIAGWAGYTIAAQVAQGAGFEMVGNPPEHYRFQSGASVALYDILRIAERTNLGDGLTPAQRAENTLQLFLGDLYTTLEQQGFLDVSSLKLAKHKRVYRLRRDKQRRVRRIRVFERGRYVKDFCVVPADNVPEADHFLTVFLQLMADESSVLDVVREYNIFSPYSDGAEQETVPAVWKARLAAPA